MPAGTERARHRVFLAETEGEVARCAAAMRSLRTHIASDDEFVRRALAQRAEGYAIAASENEAGAVMGVAGFRFLTNLFAGYHLYIDDLATLPQARSRGHGAALIDFLVALAREKGCSRVALDSGVQRFDAHRFYLRERFDIVSHHFVRKM